MTLPDELIEAFRNLTERIRALEVKEVALGSFSDATLAGAWTSVGGAYPIPGYWKAMGVVSLRGRVTGGTGTIFTLPVGYRPAGTLTLAIPANGAFGIVEVNASGVVSLVSGATPVSLDPIQFSIRA